MNQGGEPNLVLLPVAGRQEDLDVGHLAASDVPEVHLLEPHLGQGRIGDQVGHVLVGVQLQYQLVIWQTPEVGKRNTRSKAFLCNTGIKM